jgi:Rap1a immunity proteins
MFQYLRGIVLIATVNCGFAFAQDANSANYMMSGCRAWLITPAPVELRLQAGFCAGLIEGLGFGTGICIPQGVTVAQSVRVVVKYIDERPERQNENFNALAREALRAAWLCKN